MKNRTCTTSPHDRRCLVCLPALRFRTAMSPTPPATDPTIKKPSAALLPSQFRPEAGREGKGREAASPDSRGRARRLSRRDEPTSLVAEESAFEFPRGVPPHRCLWQQRERTLSGGWLTHTT